MFEIDFVQITTVNNDPRQYQTKCVVPRFKTQEREKGQQKSQRRLHT